VSVIATAGHVDHGKSALIQALTGRDPDRLVEEKRRGLTIDLGFAWMDLPSGRRISFVDVPGHRRLIGNMLTGVGSLDAVLFVVAADEGWMPQTEEHLAILDLLGVSRGVVALTKSDLVHPAAMAKAVEDVRAKIKGSTLEPLPIVPVSALTSVALAELIEALERIPEVPVSGARPRLWVDRSFTVAGAGLVVTGTLVGGGLAVGDAVTVWPSGVTARVRSLETNDRSTKAVMAVSRVAINLSGSAAVGRGSLLAKPGTLSPARRWLVELRSTRYEPELIERGSFLLYLGTLAVSATVRLLGDGLGLIEVDRDVPVQAGDRFILRETGRQRVTAGGVVLMPSPPKKSPLVELGLKLRGSLALGPDEVAGVMLAHQGRLDSTSLTNWSGGSTAGVRADGLTISDEEIRRLAEKAVELVESYHRDHPLEAGLGLGAMTKSLSIGDELARLLVEQSPLLHLQGSVVSRVGIEQGQVTADPRWPEIRENLRSLTPPTIADAGLPPDLLRALTRTGEIVRVSDDLVYLPESIDDVLAIIRSFEAPFTVSEFRSRAGVSRKYAVPLLEYADREGLTLRQGDLRTARR
jgi:selenocysteine-specific elongation factor